jgi:hypothetical protein
MADNLQTFVSVCSGGLVTNVDPLTQSNTLSGSAIRLINMEPSLEGGYRRISGYANSYGTLPGTGKVLGLAVNGEINQGILGCRTPSSGNNYLHWYNHYYDVALGTGEGAGFTVGETLTGVVSSGDSTLVAATGTVISKTSNALVVDFGKLPDNIFATGNVITGATSSATGTVASTLTVIGWTTVNTDLVANDPDGVCASQTPGGAVNLTINGALADGGSVNFTTSAAQQPRQVTITGTGDESGKNFTITGTNSSGIALVEIVAGPNNNTVNSTGYFNTITQIAVSAGTTAAITVGSGAGEYRPNNPTMTGVDIVRFERYNWSEEILLLTDGVNPAAKYNGTTYTQITHTNAPNNPKFSSAFANHLWLAGDPDEPFNIYFSSPNVDTDFDPANGAGVINIGFTITQLKSFRNQLYVFGQNQIKRIVGDNYSNFSVENVTNDLGCVAPDTVVEFGGDIIFLGPDGIRPISGTSRIGDVELETVSREIQKTFENYTANEDVTKLKALVLRRKSQFRLFFEANTSLSLLAAIRKSSSAQSTFEYSQLVGIEATAVASGYVGQFEFVLHGDTTGKVFKQEEGNSFDGSDILSVYQTPFYFMQDPELRKVFYRVKTFLKSEGESTISVGIEYNFGDAEIAAPLNFDLTTAGAASLFDASSTIYDDTDIYDGNPTPIRSTNISGSGDSISVAYVTNSTSPSHTIQAVSILYGTGDRR